MPADLITLSNPRAAAAEAYRTLRTNLMFSAVDTPLRHVAITAPTEKEEKSLALANLAVTLAQSGHRTLIVDADLRRPTQHTIWGVDHKNGLTSMILHDKAFQTPPTQETQVENLSILTSGELPANPADVLASQKMDEIITRLGELAEYILFDVPPVLVASDAAILGRKLDGVLLILKAGTSRRDKITRAKEQLDRVQVNLIGAVLTNAPKDSASYYG